MASTNKTPQGFNLWVESDKPKMEDFNHDNQLLDMALAQKSNMSDIVQLQSQKANLTEIYTRQEVYNKTESDEKFVVRSELPSLDVAAINAQLATKANVTDIETALATKVNEADIYTKTQIDSQMTNKVNIGLNVVKGLVEPASGWIAESEQYIYVGEDKWCDFYIYLNNTNYTSNANTVICKIPVGFRPRFFIGGIGVMYNRGNGYAQCACGFGINGSDLAVQVIGSAPTNCNLRIKTGYYIP